jgi:hypothetical protein
MYPKMPLYLPILGASFGFEDGVLVEIRFTVVHPSRGEAQLRLRGANAVTEALKHIGARSSDDVGAAYASINDVNIGYLELRPQPLLNRYQAAAALEAYAQNALRNSQWQTGTEALLAGLALRENLSGEEARNVFKARLQAV